MLICGIQKSTLCITQHHTFCKSCCFFFLSVSYYSEHSVYMFLFSPVYDPQRLLILQHFWRPSGQFLLRALPIPGTYPFRFRLQNLTVNSFTRLDLNCKFESPFNFFELLASLYKIKLFTMAASKR